MDIHVLKRAKCEQNNEGDGWKCRGKEGEEDRSGGGWIISGTNCRRENCQGRKRKTGLNGGDS